MMAVKRGFEEMDRGRWVREREREIDRLKREYGLRVMQV